MRQHEHVILLRNASVEPQQDANVQADPYEFAITSRGLAAHTFPVLGQEYVNVPRLVEVLQRPEDWAAVIATSKRAGEAWVNAMRQCKQAEKDDISMLFFVARFHRHFFLLREFIR